MKKFEELRDEFLETNNKNGLCILSEITSHYLHCKDQTVGSIYIFGASSRHLVLTDSILSRLGYHHYSIDCELADMPMLRIKLRNNI